MTGISCVRAAVTAVAAVGSMRALLHTCIAFTGDVDTVPAIALAAAGSPGIAPDLPRAVVDNLQSGPFGRFADLDSRLLHLVGRP